MANKLLPQSASGQLKKTLAFIIIFSMVKLEKNLIRFSSAAEYIEEYKSNITKGGIFAETELDLRPMSKSMLALYIGATDSGLRLQAEVVYCAGGRVGLQIQPGSEDALALANLADELRAGAQLSPEGVIGYRSPAAFLVDFEATIAGGGFYATSQQDWPLGEARGFTLRVEGWEKPLPFRAAVIMSQEGVVGLQIERSRENVRALNQFAIELRAALRAAAASREAARSSPLGAAEAPQAGARPLVTFQGLATASRDAEEFRALRPRRGLGEGVTLSLFDLVLSLARARQPLKLLVEANGERPVFWFDAQGMLVALEGQRTDVEYLERLVDAGFIDQEMRESLRAELGGRKDARTLAVERGAVSEHQATLVLRDQLVDALEHLRALGQVRFMVDTTVAVPPRPGGVPLEKLIISWLERALKALPAAQVKEMLKPIWAGCPRPAALAEFDLEKLELPDEEWNFARAFDGQKALKDVLAPLDKRVRDRCTRLAISLLALGVLEVEGWGQVAKAAPEKQAAQQAKTVPALANLREELARLEQANLFDRLGVHWSAHPRMFAVALQEINRNFGTESALYAAGPEAAELCRRRLQLAREALLALQDRSKRVEHRNQEVTAVMRSQSAKLMVQKAEQLLNQQQHQEAVELLEMAYELDPLPETRTRLGTVRKFYKL